MKGSDHPRVYPADDLIQRSRAVAGSGRPPSAKWFLMTVEDGYYLHPNPFPDVLFRGQNRRYSPCGTSISRGLSSLNPVVSKMSIADQALFVARLARSWWFKRELAQHPAMMWAVEHGLHVDPLTLAQHYELDTGYLDVSHSFDVAAFFATCRREGGEWHPVEEGVGVIYQIELSKVPSGPLEFAQAVGLQPLPRPEEQAAWVVEVPLGWDFETHPAVSWIEFAHAATVGRYFLDLFARGAALFPPDPLADVATRIGGSTSIPAELVDAALDSLALDPAGIRIEARADVRDAVAALVSLGPYEPLMPLHDLPAIERAWLARAATFGLATTTRPIRLVPV